MVSALRQRLDNQLATGYRRPLLAAVVRIGEIQMIQPQPVQNPGVNIVDVIRLLHGTKPMASVAPPGKAERRLGVTGPCRGWNTVR